MAILEEKVMYVHHFDDLAQKSLAAIVSALKTGGLNALAVKTHEATTWQSTYDHSPLAINGLTILTAHKAALAAQGIRLIGYCNPRTCSAAEAQMAISVGKALGGIIEIDLESWTGFQDSVACRKAMRGYCDAILAAGVKIRVDVDMRNGNLGPFNTDAPGMLKWLFGVAERIVTQTYWTTFAQTATVATNAMLALAATYAIPGSKLGIIMPANGSAGATGIQTSYGLVAAKGVKWLGLWQMGNAGAAQYSEFAKLTLTAQAPAPVPIVQVSIPVLAQAPVSAPAPAVDPWAGVGSGLVTYCKATPGFGLPHRAAATVNWYDDDHNEYLKTILNGHEYLHVYQSTSRHIETITWPA